MSHRSYGTDGTNETNGTDVKGVMDDDRQREIEQYAREAASKPIFGRHSRKEEEMEAEYRKALKENAPYLTLGFQMALTIALGALIGWWIEGPNGSGMGIGIGAAIGSVLGLGYFLKTVLSLEKKNAAKMAEKEVHKITKK